MPFDEDEFIPHGTRCEADDGRPDFGKCGESADRVVSDQGIRRYVCLEHYLWWMRDHQEFDRHSHNDPPKTLNETWNTCPLCLRTWKDTYQTAGVVHRTRLCVNCAELQKGLKT